MRNDAQTLRTLTPCAELNATKRREGNNERLTNMKRPEIPSKLSFDGCGINDSDQEFVPRIMTIPADRRQKYNSLGQALASLPDLLTAMERVLSRARHIDTSATHEGIENVAMLAHVRQALGKAGYTF